MRASACGSAGTDTRPGNQLRPGEDEVEGMKSRLNHQLGPPPGMGENPQWEVGELAAVWWRPKAENYLVRKRCAPRA